MKTNADDVTDRNGEDNLLNMSCFSSFELQVGPKLAHESKIKVTTLKSPSEENDLGLRLIDDNDLEETNKQISSEEPISCEINFDDSEILEDPKNMLF